MPSTAKVIAVVGVAAAALLALAFLARKSLSLGPLTVDWKFLSSSGTPDAVKDNRATLPVTNELLWDKSAVVGAGTPSLNGAPVSPFDIR